jgi:FKBP-type peptidyl-prolyl cis-trans isomerase FkpA
MRFFQNLIKLTVAAVVVAGCNNVEFQKTSAGVPFKVFTNKKGDSIRQNYVVRFEVLQKTKDTVLFSSYKQNAPQFLQVQSMPGKLNYNDIGGNIMEILPKLKLGDSVYMTQSTDSLLKQNTQDLGKIFKKGDQLITTLKITAVYKTTEEANAAFNKQKLEQSASREKESLEQFRKDTASQNQMAVDNKIIEDYLAKNNIQTTKTEWGVYIQTISPGQGPKPAIGQYVNVKYAGKNLNGEPFDSGVYPLQIGVGGSIKGFEEGIKQLGQGGKAVVYIPSRLGYGPNGSGPKIQPNANLVFDLEILSITDTPPQQPGNPQTQQHSEGDGHGH